MRAATLLRLLLAIAVGVFVFTCLLSSASAGASPADDGYAPAVMASQPVGLWRLGETTGGYADSSGRTPAHPGVLRQTPRSTFSRGEIDCPSFTDIDGCINMTAPPQSWPMFASPPNQSSVFVPANDSTFYFGGRRSFSLEAWVKPIQVNPWCPAFLPNCTVHLGILGSFTMDYSGSVNVGYGLYY